jgi:hypothetical protein
MTTITITTTTIAITRTNASGSYFRNRSRVNSIVNHETHEEHEKLSLFFINCLVHPTLLTEHHHFALSRLGEQAESWEAE